MTFTVQWPDGRVESCYSPSLVVHEHLQVDEEYAVGDFSRRATYALALASDRVRETFGFACTSAMATSEQIQARAAEFGAGERVRVVSMRDGGSRVRQEPTS